MEVMGGGVPRVPCMHASICLASRAWHALRLPSIPLHEKQHVRQHMQQHVRQQQLPRGHARWLINLSEGDSPVLIGMHWLTTQQKRFGGLL